MCKKCLQISQNLTTLGKRAASTVTITTTGAYEQKRDLVVAEIRVLNEYSKRSSLPSRDEARAEDPPF